MSVPTHISRTLRLAIPVMLSRAGLIFLVLIDSAMTGNAGTLELAYYSLGSAPQFIMMLVGLGALLGTIVLTAQAVGAKRCEDCGQVWIVAMQHAAGYGLLMLLLAHGGEWFLLATGQTPDLARGAGQVIILFAYSLPAMLMFIATTLFLEGINRPLPGLLVMFFANIVNAGLNWILIFGHLGLPAMGADGATLATTIARWFMVIAICGFVLLSIDRKKYGINNDRTKRRKFGRQLRRLGYPMALGQGLESGSFGSMMFLAGWVSPVTVAAYQINLSLISLVFMFSQGFATAASVRVANAVGRGDPAGARTAGWTAVLLAVLVLAIWSIVFILIPERLATIYTNDQAVLTAAVSALIFAAFVIVPDGFQAVLIAALRGLSDVWPATLLFFIAFWLVMVPAAYWFAVYMQQGVVGLIRGMLLGCIVAAVLLAVRFHWATRHLTR